MSNDSAMVYLPNALLLHGESLAAKSIAHEETLADKYLIPVILPTGSRFSIISLICTKPSNKNMKYSHAVWNI